MQQKHIKTRAAVTPSTTVSMSRNRVFSVECLEDPPSFDEVSEIASEPTPLLTSTVSSKVAIQFDPVTVGDYIVLRSADSFATDNYLCGDAAWMRVGSQFQQAERQLFPSLLLLVLARLDTNKHTRTQRRVEIL